METLNLSGNNLLIDGAKKVISCTHNQAVVDTTEKRIVISGNEIEVKKLNLENSEVCLSGNFTNIKLSSEQEKKPFLKRIFK